MLKQTIILFKFFKGCLPQILLGPLLNTSSLISLVVSLCGDVEVNPGPICKQNEGSSFDLPLEP